MECTLDFTFVVTYDAISCEVKCQYLLFELRGILCRLYLSALSFELVGDLMSFNWSEKVGDLVIWYSVHIIFENLYQNLRS
ncbi:hypothetical protein AHAS_Ahas07G0097300 [Arachis hypogaea]